MKERPILFSGAMVRALLDGRKKTQTRRVVKAPKGLSNPADFLCVRPGGVNWKDEPVGPAVAFGPRDAVEWAHCPYGTIGDRLWVRETWFDNNPGERDMEQVFYRADGEPDFDGESIGRDGPGWSPSIHMPRWASRITLEITGVRVERVQYISDGDAIAEGCGPAALSADPMCRHSEEWGAYEEFARLWDSINGKRPGCSWESNPWVWCLEFKRVEGEGPAR